MTRSNRLVTRAITTLMLLVTTASLLVIAGCHRSYYRRQADCEARTLIREKLNDPRWSQIDPSIETMPDSRMHDPFSADHPPMPTDDGASQELMHCVDNKPGYQHWHVNGDTQWIENPDWRSYLPLNEQGVLVLDLETAVQLSLIHSADLQRQRETLYLSALDVSLERFGFDAQGFNGLTTFFRTQGREAPGGTTSTLNVSPGPSGTRLQKLGISGATLAVNVANSVIWNFAGANSQSATALIDFSIIQPLLRGAGRQIVMESLTQAERTLLANVRQLERFRRGFYLNVVTGRNAGAGLSRTGNFLNEPIGGSANPGGFLGLLQTQQEIRIAEFNVRSLENFLEQFREFFNEQRINLLQVRQAENALYSAQSSLLSLKVQYQNELDQFKRTLGLPPDLVVDIDDPLLTQFELIGDELLERQLQVNALRSAIGVTLEGINPQIDETGQKYYEWSDDLNRAILSLVPVMREIDPYFEMLQGEDRELVEKDLEVLQSVTDRRRAELESLRQFIEESEIDYEIEPSILQPEAVASAGQLGGELQRLQDKVNNIRGKVETLIRNIDRLSNDGPTLTRDQLTDRMESEIVFEAPEITTMLADVIIEMTLIQARARSNSILLPEVNLNAETAASIACQFRRDLMNARASLVDQWRQIELVADDLESTLDVVFEGSVGSTTDNPFRLNWNSNQFGMGFRFDAPITRFSERNRYRQTLIDYQQARRNFYNFEDAIKENLRRTIRSIEQNKVLFELNRRSISTAIEQLELARFSLSEPVRPGTGGGRGTTLGPTAANDLTNASNRLQSEQTQFLNRWVTYEVLRRGLDFDLGTMQLSPDGAWLDPGTINAMYIYRAAEAFGIPADSVCLPNGDNIQYQQIFEEAIDGNAPNAPPLRAVPSTPESEIDLQMDSSSSRSRPVTQAKRDNAGKNPAVDYWARFCEAPPSLPKFGK